MIRLLRVAVLAALATAAALGAQERVDLDVPAFLDVRTLETGRAVAAPPVRLELRHALLRLGRRLRVSVRADGLGEESGVAALSFTTANALGGAGGRGRLAPGVWVPVFDGRPLAVSGGVEITWTVETAARIARAGAHEVALRWRVESVPVEGEMDQGRAGTVPVALLPGMVPDAPQAEAGRESRRTAAATSERRSKPEG